MNSTNVNKVCRLCLFEGSESDTVPIYNNSEIDLPTKIKECVSLNVDMKELNIKFPSVICFNCLQQLNQWLNFRDVCHHSHNILVESINNRTNDTNKFCLVKDEALDNENKGDDFLPENVYNNLKIDIQTDSHDSDNCVPEPIEEVGEKPKCKIQKNRLKTRRKVRYKRRKKKLKETKAKNLDVGDKSEDLERYLQKIEQEHIESELKKEILNNTYNCDICDSSFTSIFEYLDHQETHNGEPVFKCHKCIQVFTSRKELVEHDTRHQIPCPKCGKLILPTCMKVHLILHTDRFKCVECHWRFSNSTMLRQHIESVHIRIKTHVCETCGKSFTSTTSLQTHIKIHSDVRPYTCKICDYSGRTASALYTHMARHENGLHVCEVCAKSFKSFRSLRDHTRRVHSEKKNHECGVCHKKFVDRYMLTVHTRTHTGARPYQCTHCDRAFVRSDGLKEHLATHGERPCYNCEQCGKKFIYRRSLGRHSCISVGN